ncbi:MAG TPA: tetratricopeptide repeat protein [Sandaracinaceae bacterium LLY-WYZ-13_1]|nr:tetratricopeptide repeat protein [Sandaracinaceae bacterium LLY-WYZ-13_1]
MEDEGESPRLGAFRLEAPIGTGGMATVWRGVHRTAGAPAAIKLVSADSARDRARRESLANEVRAMARLDHPGIVAVLDYGRVSEAAARVSGGRLVAGSPFLAMELANAGSLRRGEIDDWSGLRRALTALLDALAHAHARGVVHRDLKPSNVLLHEDADGTRTLRLSDFGIAHALERTRDRREAPVVAGTAWFMAPEQILGLARDEGPWTDLYALGCLAYLLASDTLPFGGRDRELVYRAHCLEDPPPLAPSFEVPAALEDWIGVLLAKRPRERFETAADARLALARLGGGPLRSATTPPTSRAPTAGEDAPTVADTPSGRAVEQPTTEIEPAPPPPGSLPTTARAAARERLRDRSIPAVPPDPPSGPRPRAPRLLGIGLGVYGLRPIPLAGRAAERAQLWRGLADVARTRAPRAVAITGRAGYGKTRLAEWLVERAAEQGAAHVLWVHHDPSAPLDGVTRMVQRHLRAEGLEGDALARRVAEATPALDDRRREPLVALLSPSDGRPRSSRREERFAIARDLLLHVCARRPAILVFDDAQLGEDSIAFVEYLLRQRATEAPAVLALLTARDEGLEDRPAEAEALARLVERPRADRLAVDALPPNAHARLVAELLGLSPALARQVAERTAGNPLFAVQLVGDWVQRGALAAGRRGFTLRPDARVVVPDDIHALWSERIDRLVASMPARERPAAETALALMALLGRRVEREEWRLACERAGAPAPEGLLDAMAVRRLARVGRRAFSLVHAMLHESLRRRARERDDEAALHGACAEAIEAGRGDDAGHAERLGDHRVAAGRLTEALPALRQGVEARLATCEFREARAACLRHDAALDALGAARDDSRRGRGWLQRAEVAGVQGLLDEADGWLRRAEGVARANDDRALLGGVRRLQGGVFLKRGRPDRALGRFAEGGALSAAVGDRRGEAACRHGEGECLKLLGRLDEAEAAYRAAVTRFEPTGDRQGIGRAQMGLADVVRRRGRLDAAAALLEASTDAMRRYGNRQSEGVGLNTLGDIARAQGRLEQALRRYREALRVLDAVGSEEALIVRLNLGLVLLARGEWAEARAFFEAVLPELDEAGREGFRVYVEAGRFAAAAGLGDFAEVARLAPGLDRLLADTAIVDEDVAASLELAGDRSAAANRPAWAATAWERARTQWDRLSRESPRMRVDAKLAGL